MSTATSEIVDWITIQNPVGEQRQPHWLRTAGVLSDGAVLLPGAFAPCGEAAAIVRACWAGTAITLFENHAFFPVDWLVREFPDITKDCRHIEDRARVHAARLQPAETAPLSN